MLPIEIESKLSKIRGLLAAQGAELIDISLRKSGGRGVLTVIADKAGGITLEDCAEINRRLGLFFDESPFGDYPYTLEVSSPGLDRPIRTEADFLRVLGEELRVIALDESRKTWVYTGKALAVTGGVLELALRGSGEIKRLELSSVVKAVRDIKI